MERVSFLVRYAGSALLPGIELQILTFVLYAIGKLNVKQSQLQLLLTRTFATTTPQLWDVRLIVFLFAVVVIVRSNLHFLVHLRVRQHRIRAQVLWSAVRHHHALHGPYEPAAERH